jgi:lipoprotein signal peptidase
LFTKFKEVAAEVMKVTDIAFLIMDQELKYLVAVNKISTHVVRHDKYNFTVLANPGFTPGFDFVRDIQ